LFIPGPPADDAFGQRSVDAREVARRADDSRRINFQVLSRDETEHAKLVEKAIIGDAVIFSEGALCRGEGGYSTETRMTPDRIMPSARAALIDTSMTRPRTKGPRSLTRHCIERPAPVTVTMLPNGLVR
jgi:hypothetical protein